MKSIEELNPHAYPTNPNIDKNLGSLFQRLMELQAACKMDFVFTSALRSEAAQQVLVETGKTNAIHSKHCAGAAADIYDPKKKLQKYLTENSDILKVIGLWCEDFKYTKNWVHCQTLAPLSGKRFFIP